MYTKIITIWKISFLYVFRHISVNYLLVYNVYILILNSKLYIYNGGLKHTDYNKDVSWIYF